MAQRFFKKQPEAAVPPVAASHMGACPSAHTGAVAEDEPGSRDFFLGSKCSSVLLSKSVTDDLSLFTRLQLEKKVLARLAARAV